LSREAGPPSPTVSRHTVEYQGKPFYCSVKGKLILKSIAGLNQLYFENIFTKRVQIKDNHYTIGTKRCTCRGIANVETVEVV